MSRGDMLFLNVQFLSSHLGQLKLIVASIERQQLVLALSKTSLTNNDPLDFYHLGNYRKKNCK